MPNFNFISSKLFSNLCQGFNNIIPSGFKASGSNRAAQQTDINVANFAKNMQHPFVKQSPYNSINSLRGLKDLAKDLTLPHFSHLNKTSSKIDFIMGNCHKSNSQLCFAHGLNLSLSSPYSVIPVAGQKNIFKDVLTHAYQSPSEAIVVDSKRLSEIISETLDTEKVCNNSIAIAVKELDQCPLDKLPAFKNLKANLENALFISNQALAILNACKDSDMSSSNQAAVIGTLLSTIAKYKENLATLFYYQDKILWLRTKDNSSASPALKQALKLFDKVINSGNGPLEMDAYLIAAAQRYPRYILLAEQMLKCVDESSPAYTALSKGIQDMKGFVSYINKNVKELEA
ncbi:MAG: gxcG [Chlamydiales bacterium]|jgi:hypothetical protein|nr:gxcG [Chlamydiales bacterium]